MSLRPRFDFDDLGRDILREVLAANALPMTGAQKRRRVVRRLADDLDDRMTWGSGPVARWAERVDGPVVRASLAVGVEVAVVAIRSLPVDVLPTLEAALVRGRQPAGAPAASGR